MSVLQYFLDKSFTICMLFLLSCAELWWNACLESAFLSFFNTKNSSSYKKNWFYCYWKEFLYSLLFAFPYCCLLYSPPPPNNCRILKIRKFEMLFIGLECSCFPCLFHNMQLIELYGRNNTKILQRQVYPRKGKRFGRRIQVPPLIP